MNFHNIKICFPASFLSAITLLGMPAEVYTQVKKLLVISFSLWITLLNQIYLMDNFFPGNSVLDGAGFHPNDSFGGDPSLYSRLSSASGRSRILFVFFLTIWRLDFWKLDFFLPGTLFLPLPRASLQSNGAILYFIIKSQLSKSSSSSSSSRLPVIMTTKIINRCDCHLQAFRPLLITTTIIINWSRWWKRCDC